MKTGLLADEETSENTIIYTHKQYRPRVSRRVVGVGDGMDAPPHWYARPCVLRGRIILLLLLLCVSTAAAATAASTVAASTSVSRRLTPSSPTSVLITGSTGVLGRALVAHALASTSTSTHTIFTTHRRRSMDHWAHPPVNALFLDASNRADVSSFFTRHQLQPSHLVVINNAGVCVDGQSATGLKASLDVNCWAPALLAEAAAAEAPERNVTVVNVSSGDGELVYLHSDVARRVHALDSVEVGVPPPPSPPSLSSSSFHPYPLPQAWKAYLNELEATFDPSFSYAHGPTPLYSLSKALLNAYTRLSNCVGAPERRRVLAVCPGNFESPMTTADERESGLLATPDAAAADVWALAVDPNYPGGRFYRHRREIAW